MKKTGILKKIAAGLLAAAMLAGSAVTAHAASVADFEDVTPKAWYYNAVEYAADNGLFQGTTPNKFSPNGAMQRGMFVAVLSRYAQIDESQYLLSRFNDVKQGNYYAVGVEWAARYGIVSGTGKKTFSPLQNVTREQIATFLYRYAKATGNDTSYSEEAYNSFPDRSQVSAFAVEAMKWATFHGIINGSDGKLKPKGTATRAQVAQVFLSAKDILISNTMVVEPQMPEEEPVEPSTDPKAHPNSVFNVFAREYSAANDWQVSSKSKMDSSEQAQLIELLKGKTGNMVWNDIALNGMTTGQVGATRTEKYIGADSDGSNQRELTARYRTVSEVAANIEKRLSDVPDAKYFCIEVEDFTDAMGVNHEELFYKLYFINTPDAFVDPADSAYTAKVKRLVAERLPSGFVWSKKAKNGGWSTSTTWYGGGADEEADFIVHSYEHMWISDGKSHEGKVCYYISFEGIDEWSGREILKHYCA